MIKIKKFNESNKSEFHMLTIKDHDHMGSVYTDIFETLYDAESWLLSYVYDTVLEHLYDEDEVDEFMLELISEEDIEEIIYKYNDFSEEIGLEEKIIYSKGELQKPKLTKEEFVKKWELKMNAKKYNL